MPITGLMSDFIMLNTVEKTLSVNKKAALEARLFLLITI